MALVGHADAATRQKVATVDEVVLIPGDESIVAPERVPYRERIQPGDLSPGDLLPVEDGDPRLVPTYSFGDDDLSPDDRAQIKSVATDLYLGRVRTLSIEGRDQAAERWYDGDGGPDAPLAQSAPASCTSCGFLVRLAGPLSALFGVCANGSANDDGKVDRLDHGCGAHSEVQFGKQQLPEPLPEHVFDTVTVDEIESFRPTVGSSEGSCRPRCAAPPARGSRAGSGSARRTAGRPAGSTPRRCTRRLAPRASTTERRRPDRRRPAGWLRPRRGAGPCTRTPR